MPALNYETSGSEIQSIKNNTNRSTADIIINEDYAMIIKVTSIEAGIVKGIKVWDEAEVPTIFSAILKFRGFDGTPEDSSIKIDEHVVFHRVGEAKGIGKAGFELHGVDNDKSSWICLIDSNPVIFVQDSGSGSGSNVKFNGTSWVTPGGAISLNFISPDPVTSYHNGVPPWKVGRRYAAQRIGNKYIVFLPGFGNPTKSFSQTVNSVKWDIKTDSSGKIIEFNAVGVT